MEVWTDSSFLGTADELFECFVYNLFAKSDILPRMLDRNGTK